MILRIFLILFLLPSLVYSYTVVRKDGRPFSGDLIRESSEAIVLEDKSGIQVTFRLDQLDMEKTKAANAGAPAQPPAKPQSFAAIDIQKSKSDSKSKYTGELITVDFKDIDIRDFFRFIADLSGMNLIIDPSVKGSLTIRLNDVPWDQALDIVCRTHKLGYEIDGNVMSVD